MTPPHLGTLDRASGSFRDPVRPAVGRARRCVLVACVLTGGICAASDARGASWELIPSLSLSERWDDDLVTSADGDGGAFITRVAPELRTRWQAPRWAGTAGYSFGVEILDDAYGANGPGDDNTSLRHAADARIRHDASRRLRLLLDATYIDTPASSELGGSLVFDVGRLRTRHMVVTPGARLRLDERTTLRGRYRYTLDFLAELTNQVHGLLGALERRVMRRHEAGVEARFEAFRFGDEGDARSVAVLGTWTFRPVRVVRLEGAAGVRLTREHGTGEPAGAPSRATSDAWFVDAPEVRLGVRYEDRGVEVGGRYARTTGSIPGIVGTTRTEQVGVTAAHAPHPDVRLAFMPTWWRLLGPADEQVVSVGGEVRWGALEWMAVHASYRFTWQRFRAERPTGVQRAASRHNVVLLGLVIGPRAGSRYERR
ncbi:MAG: hypothetical protein ACQEXJ_18255 [Myxococcota bacterium]